MNGTVCQLLIIVPLYRAPELIEGLFANLRSVADEVTALGAQVVLINDSPDDAGLAAALASEAAAGLSTIDFEIMSNERNLGFVKSANRGLRLARDRRVDALLMNSDVLLAPGALVEMQAVSRGDPLIAVVGPRSNNATISNSPYAERFRDYDFAEALAAHEALLPHLPQVTYVPTAVGFCLYIRYVALAEFGVFDEIYGAGYNEENDFILRCSRNGYRAVLANRAFAFHLGSVSFDQSGEGRSSREAQNRIILDDRYPEYTRAIERYFESTEYRAQLLCSELLPNRNQNFSILFDCRNIGSYYNGTFEHARRIITAFSNIYSDKYRILIACDEEAYEFHQLGYIKNVNFVTVDDAKISCYSFCIRIGQPFEWSDLVDVCSSAPISGFLMLDTIAMDCLNLDEKGLERIWRQMLNVASLIGFNSRFTRDQFVHRFPLPDDVLDFVSLCSTDIADYEPPLPVTVQAGMPPCILVVGNHFKHKNVRATVALLKPAAKTQKIIVLGIDLTDEEDIVSYKSGFLSEEEVDQIYASATVVLFPSHYEGFGLPILHALARNIPVVARDLPVFREIRDRTECGANIHLCESTQAMVDLALSSPEWTAGGAPVEPVQSWDRAAIDLHEALMEATSRFDVRHLKRRLDSIDLCREWLDAVEEADAAWLGSDRSQTRIRRDDLAKAGRTSGQQRSITSASMTLLRRVSWNAVRLRQRLPIPLARTAEDHFALQGTLPEGDRLTLSSSRIDHLSGDGEWAVIYARDHLDTFSVRDFCIRLLEVSDKLAMGGVVFFSVNVAARRQTLPIDASSPHGVGILCANAGLKVEAIETIGARILVAATKGQVWLDVPVDGDDHERFVRDLYRAAFRRDVDEYSKVYVEQLKAGASRLALAKKLFSSVERIGVLTRKGSRTRFGKV